MTPRPPPACWVTLPRPCRSLSMTTIGDVWPRTWPPSSPIRATCSHPFAGGCERPRPPHWGSISRLVGLDGASAEAGAAGLGSYAPGGASVGRVTWLARLLGASRSLVRFFTAGVSTVATYDAPVYGVRDGLLGQVRSWAAATLRPRAPGRSLGATCLLHGDPGGNAAAAAAERWAREVWLPSWNELAALGLTALACKWCGLRSKPAPSWRCARGPVDAARAELRA